MRGATPSADRTTSGRWLLGRLTPSSLSPRVRQWFWAGHALTAVAWFWAFPLRQPVPILDPLFDLLCLGGALFALVYIQRIGFAPIEIGWRLFIWGLLIRVLGVLTNQPNMPDGAASLLRDGPETIGIAALVWGFFRYWRRGREEIDLLTYRLHFEHLASDLSRSFVSTSPDELDGQIERALAKIAEAFDLDRVSVWWFDETRSKAIPKYSWDRDPTLLPPSIGPADVPWLWAQIVNGRTFSFERPDQLPADAEPDRSLFASVGIKSLFCAPLRFNETSLGGCGFATLRRSRRWPSRQTKGLAMLTEVLACAAARSQAHKDLLRREAALSEQLQFQRFVAELSSTFLTIPAEDIDQHVTLAFRRIADTYDLDRVGLWWFDRDAESSSFSHVWVQSGVPPPRTIPGADVPWIRAQMIAGETVVIDSPDQLPPHAAGEREYFSKTQIQSLLLIPHAVGASESAASVFSKVRQRRKWSKAAIEQLRFLGEVIVGAVVRGRADHALLQRDEELAQAQRIAHVGSYAFLPGNGETHFSEELCRILGCQPDDASHGRLLAAVHPDERQRVSKAVQRALASDSLYEQEYRVVRADGSVRHVQDRGEIDRDASGQVVQVLGAVLDITERKKAEEALSQALSQLEGFRDQLQAENLYLRDEIRLTHGFDKIIGDSLALRRCLRKVEQVAATDSTVLILGETGTGKELIAHSIHDLSKRKDGPLVSVNCAALQPTLIEAELFGNEKGAFTGAEHAKPGRFEIAHGGTLFLDEIGDLPLELQSKLLRVLQESEFERVGGTKKIKVDVRLIAATNRDLERAVERGEFRADLYYRLNVFPIALPPLRERREDIPTLVEYFVRKHARRLGRDVTGVSARMLSTLAAQPWLGNVRELENWVLRALVSSSGPTLDIEGEPQTVPKHHSRPDGLPQQASSELKDVESTHIQRVLEECRWVIEGDHGAAARLGLNPSTLRSRMRKLGIRRPQSGPRSSVAGS